MKIEKNVQFFLLRIWHNQTKDLCVKVFAIYR